MRYRNFIKGLTVLTIGLGLGVGTNVINSQPVQAISKRAAVNKPGYRKVRILKRTCVRKIHWKSPTYQSTLGPKRYVSRNDIVRIMQTGTDFGWYMRIPGYSGEYTIVKHYNDYSWFTLNTRIPKPKRYKEGWSGNTYQTTNGTTLKIKSLKRLSVFNYDNDDSKPDETDLVLTAQLTNNGSKKIGPSHWLENNILIYPVGTSDDHMLIDGTDDQMLTDDESYSDKFEERTDKLSKDYYTTFSVILDGDDSDLTANNYVFSDKDGHKITVPVENSKVSVDVED